MEEFFLWSVTRCYHVHHLIYIIGSRVHQKGNFQGYDYVGRTGPQFNSLETVPYKLLPCKPKTKPLYPYIVALELLASCALMKIRAEWYKADHIRINIDKISQ